jgi:hypothetical protein
MEKREEAKCFICHNQRWDKIKDGWVYIPGIILHECLSEYKRFGEPIKIKVLKCEHCLSDDYWEDATVQEEKSLKSPNKPISGDSGQQSLRTVPAI